MVRKVRLSLPEDVVQKATIVAAWREMSLSELVASLLAQAVDDVEDYDAVWQGEIAYMKSAPIRVGEVTWTRADLHEP